MKTTQSILGFRFTFYPLSQRMNRHEASNPSRPRAFIEVYEHIKGEREIDDPLRRYQQNANQAHLGLLKHMCRHQTRMRLAALGLKWT